MSNMFSSVILKKRNIINRAVVSFSLPLLVTHPLAYSLLETLQRAMTALCTVKVQCEFVSASPTTLLEAYEKSWGRG